MKFSTTIIVLMLVVSQANASAEMNGPTRSVYVGGFVEDCMKAPPSTAHLQTVSQMLSWCSCLAQKLASLTFEEAMAESGRKQALTILAGAVCLHQISQQGHDIGRH
jgi:hypothetical protein